MENKKIIMHVLNVLLTLSMIILMLKMINFLDGVLTVLELILVICGIKMAKYWVQLKYNVTDTLQENKITKVVYFSSVGFLILAILALLILNAWVVILFPISVLLLCVALALSFLLKNLNNENKDVEVLDL